MLAMLTFAVGYTWLGCKFFGIQELFEQIVLLLKGPTDANIQNACLATIKIILFFSFPSVVYSFLFRHGCFPFLIWGTSLLMFFGWESGQLSFLDFALLGSCLFFMLIAGRG